MITRRTVLKAIAAIGFSGLSVGGYAFAIEPWGHRVTRYRPQLPGWPADFQLRIAALADIHASEPWMDVERIEQLVSTTNALQADVILLLGDYASRHRFVRRRIAPDAWARPLAGLRAPLGVHAILGNHDWWDDWTAQQRYSGPTLARRALENVGIPVYENDARRLVKDGRAFWLAGLGDQWAFYRHRDSRRRRERFRYEGVDDLPATLARLADDAPAILMLHEPDAFPGVPARIALSLCGHTHGGQVTFAGFAPIVPSRYGRRYLYGHIVEENRHLIVSGGLGCSGLPLRLGVPPEIVLVELGEKV